MILYAGPQDLDSRLPCHYYPLTQRAVVLDGVTSFCLCATAATASVHRHGNWVTEIICFGLC